MRSIFISIFVGVCVSFVVYSLSFGSIVVLHVPCYIHNEYTTNTYMIQLSLPFTIRYDHQIKTIRILYHVRVYAIQYNYKLDACVSVSVRVCACLCDLVYVWLVYDALFLFYVAKNFPFDC